MKKILLWLIILMILLVICAAVVLLGGQYLAGQTVNPAGLFSSPPTIRILKPIEGFRVSSGQGLLVSAEAGSVSGLARVEFLVDGVVAQQYIPANAGIQADTASFLWFASRAGSHQLGVTAYDTQGRASLRAVVRVDVIAEAGILPAGKPALPTGGVERFPVVPGAPDGVPSEPQPGDGQPAAPDDPNGADQPQQGDDQPAAPDDPNGADQPQPGDDQPDAPVDPGSADQPQPQDAPPVISQFRILTSIDGNGVVTANPTATATDDLGVKDIILVWGSDGGEQGQFSVVCAGDPACSLQRGVVTGPGKWIFSVQAVDTSGQASAPVFLNLQVLANPDLPPAAAVDESDDGSLSDWFMDHIGNLNDWFAGTVDWRDILAGWENERSAEPEPGIDVEARNDCLGVTIDPRPDGNHITLTILCDLRAQEEGSFLVPIYARALANSGITANETHPPGWNDPARTTIPAGFAFSWVDTDASCGMTYIYRFRIDQFLPLAIGSTSHIVKGPLHTEVRAMDCRQGAIGDVNLRSETVPDGVRVQWTIEPDAQLPVRDLPDGAFFRLVRNNLETSYSDILFNQNISRDELRAGGDYQVLDNTVFCGNSYVYTLLASDVENVLYGEWRVFLRAQVTAPENPCDDALGALALRLEPIWVNDNYLRVRMGLQIPPGLNWPQEENLTLDIMRTPPGDGFNRPTQWAIVTRIDINREIRDRGYNLTEDDTGVDFYNPVYLYRLRLRVGNREVRGWPVVEVVMPDSPPPSPNLSRLTATNNCPNGVPRCVVVDWQPYNQPEPDEGVSQATRIIIERTVGVLDRHVFNVDLEDTRYVDISPFMQDFVLSNGEQHRVCLYNVNYRILALDAEGHHQNGRGLSIDTPGCDVPWNVIERSN